MASLILTDPRCFAPSSQDPYVVLAEHWLGQSSATQRGQPYAELIERYRSALEASRDAEIAASLREATSAGAYRCLWVSLNRAFESDAGTDRTLVTRLFAIPLLIVTGGRGDVTVPGVVPDIAAAQRVLAQSGALGQARNFGLSNALCALETLERVPLSRVYRLGLGLGDEAGGSTGLAAFDLPPSDVIIASADEQVHLRFLAGAAITAADAPSFLETGANIGAWGMPLTRELAAQLNVEGLSILPIPRPPQAWFAAQVTGWRAREELAFQAFVSRVLRRFRAEIGEPDVTIAPLNSGVVGVRFASPLIEDRVDIHRWRPHPLDDITEIADSILGLLAECRLDNVEVLPTVVSEEAFAVNPAVSRMH